MADADASTLEAAEDIDRIAVLGAGNMGHGIAEVAALAGYEVSMRDIDEDLVREGYESIEWSLGKLVENDRIDDDHRRATLDRIDPVVDVAEAVGDADLVVEAVPERFDVKREVYGEVLEHLPPRAILATNTSSLSITDLSEATDRPERFCGMHFFNPPVRMELVEVVSGAHTDGTTLDVVEDLARRLDKTPVRVRKDSPGFVVNRILVPLMNEAAWLLAEDTATREAVDSTTKYGIGLPMGALELADYVGLDVGYDVLEYMHEELGEAYEPCPLLAGKVEDGDLGKKSGAGFYEYGSDDGGPEVPADRIDETVRRRMLAVMANEVGNLVAGDVADPPEIDQAVRLGGNFPEGPAKLADDHGLTDLVEALEAAAEATDHPRYGVSEGLRAAAERGGFHADAGGDGDEGADAGGDDGDGEGAPDYETLRVEYPGDRVARVVLDRPHRMNTVTTGMLDEIEAVVDDLEADDEVRAILLVGAGDRAFSAGADVQSLAGSATPLGGVEISRQGQRAFGRLAESDLPVLAAIDGYCLGGGMELATCADLRIATGRSELGQPEHDLGLLPGWGGTQRLQRIVGAGRAKEIIFTADRYDAAEMYEYGFLNEVVDADEFEDRAHELAADLAAGPPIAQRFTKRAMHVGWENERAGLEVEAEAFGHLMDTDDLMEGVTAFMSDRDPEFEGQ